MKRWKVVNLDRTSCSVSNRTYKLKYEVGSIVESDPDTLGIFVFNNIENATSFLKSMEDVHKRSYKIIEVETLEEELEPEFISRFVDRTSIRNFFRLYHSLGARAPIGTICCKMVKVLT